MRGIGLRKIFPILLGAFPFILCSCSSMQMDSDDGYRGMAANNQPQHVVDYSERMPQTIETASRTVVVDPRVHAWGAYDGGQLVKAGNASAGSDWCGDLHRPCHTRVGTFHVSSLGGPDCKSHIFPLHKGGAPMPYCMYFNNGQALHGVPDSEVGEGNFSHGCVRMHVSDAEWLRYNFVNVGTKVIVKPYN